LFNINTELFTGKAKQYANARPDYPKEAIDYICKLVSNSAIFADIGAGTGKFTKNIAERGYQIYAVEPNKDMMLQLKTTLHNYPQTKIIEAPAEATTLSAKSIDIVVCAQAMHWFDLAKFAEECRRITKPDSIIMAVYNVVPGGSSINHSRLSTEIFFKNPIIKEFPNPIYYTREKWLEYMTSHSYDPLPNDVGYANHIKRINSRFDKESIDGFLCLNILTKVYYEKW